MNTNEWIDFAIDEIQYRSSNGVGVLTQLTQKKILMHIIQNPNKSEYICKIIRATRKGSRSFINELEEISWGKDWLSLNIFDILMREGKIMGPPQPRPKIFIKNPKIDKNI